MGANVGNYGPVLKDAYKAARKRIQFDPDAPLDASQVSDKRSALVSGAARGGKAGENIPRFDRPLRMRRRNRSWA
jgi:hypothetical protein